MRLGTPRYFYHTEKNLVKAQIVLPNMQSIWGDLCSDPKLAAENVSMKVYKELNLDKGIKPQHFFDLRPPNAWTNTPPSMPQNMPMNMQPPMNIPMNIQPPSNINLQSMMSPRSFPDPRKPPIRPPTSWNQMPPQTPAPFTQMAQMPPMPSMHLNPQVRPIHQTSSGPGPAPQNHPKSGLSLTDKPEVIKQSTPFVPLQAQKKNKQRKSKETPEDNKELAPKPAKSKTVNNSPKVDSKPLNKAANEQLGMFRDNSQAQKTHKPPRQRKSRIAANFPPTPAPANGNNAQ